jgi:hypothetical protein
VTTHATLGDAFSYLQRCTSILREEFEKGLSGVAPATVHLPDLSPDEETRFRVGLVETLRGGDKTANSWLRQKLLTFMEHTQRPVRVLPYQERGRRVGVVHYLTLIPESLRRLIVLDASHNIRLLTSGYDTSLRVTSVDCAIKSFEAVTVTHYVQGAGRERLYADLPKATSATTRRLMDILGTYPSDEGVIVATFKPSAEGTRKKPVDHAALLQDHMRDSGIDPEGKLPDGRPRFVFLTWGAHVGISDYATADMFSRWACCAWHPSDVAAKMIGQRGDLLEPSAADPSAVDTVTQSEMFHTSCSWLAVGPVGPRSTARRSG